MLGELYEAALAGWAQPQIERADGRLTPLGAGRWLAAVPGDESVLRRCCGPTLDVGAGPGRLTVALAERGVPALAIDVTPYAVGLARSSGALALHRDVFASVPGTGRWARALLADGNIGIGGDPAALLLRISELLMPGGLALVEVQPPGVSMVREQVRLRQAAWAAAGSRGHRSAPTKSEGWAGTPAFRSPRPGRTLAAGSPPWPHLNVCLRAPRAWPPASAVMAAWTA
ncbi:MAG TPA: SAM-dependent methyltransferase [Streptosporangiaceae bacterium]